MGNVRCTPFRLAFLGLVAALAACDSTTAPGVEPEIVNETDSFFYQLRDLSDVTGTWEYTWENTGTVATVTHSTNAGASGTAILTVRDATGTPVYTGPLLSSGEPATSPAGEPGDWTVSLAYSGYTNAQVNFELSRR